MEFAAASLAEYAMELVSEADKVLAGESDYSVKTWAERARMVLAGIRELASLGAPHLTPELMFELFDVYGPLNAQHRNLTGDYAQPGQAVFEEN